MLLLCFLKLIFFLQELVENDLLVTLSCNQVLPLTKGELSWRELAGRWTVRGRGLWDTWWGYGLPSHSSLATTDVCGPLSWLCFAATCLKTVLTWILKVPSRFISKWEDILYFYAYVLELCIPQIDRESLWVFLWLMAGFCQSLRLKDLLQHRALGARSSCQFLLPNALVFSLAFSSSS